MRNLISKGMSYVPAVASVLMVIALGFEIADHIRSWKKSKKTTSNNPEEKPEEGNKPK